MLAFRSTVVCEGGLNLWDSDGYPTSCFVDLWLPLALLAGIFLSVPIQFAWKILIGGTNTYEPVPTSDEDGALDSEQDAIVVTSGTSPESFWPLIQTTLVLGGIIVFGVRLLFGTYTERGGEHELLSALLNLFAWLAFWIIRIRSSTSLSDTAVFFFTSFNTVAAVLKLESYRNLDDDNITALEASAIAQVVVSALLLVTWGLGALCHLNERHELLSRRERTNPDVPLPSLETRVSWFEQAIFAWVTPLLLRGERRPLEKTDVWALNPKDRAVLSHRLFVSHAGHQGAQVFHALYIMIRHILGWQVFFGLLCGLLEFTGPFFLNRIVKYLESKPESQQLPGQGQDGDDTNAMRSVPWLYIFGLLIGSMVRTVADNRAYLLGRRIGLRVKGALISQIYAKVLRRRQHGGKAASADADADAGNGAGGAATGGGNAEQDAAQPAQSHEESDSATIGELQTLFSVDVDKIAEFSAYVQNLVGVPLQLVVALGSLYALLGWSALFGVGLMIVYLPLQSFTGGMIQKRQRVLMKKTDSRVTLVNEMLQGIRMIKYFHFEPKFADKINARRSEELYVALQGGTLNATIVFTALSLFSLLKGPLYMFPMIINRVLELRVSLERIGKLMREDESAAQRQATIGFGGDASFGWSSDDTKFHLRDINITFKPGGLNVVIGRLAAERLPHVHHGTTRLEMYTKSGVVMKPDSTAYVAQSAWLQSDTIRANIKFGATVDDSLYRNVLRACALERDLKAFDQGDLTQIGERGVRIQLARATLFSLVNGPSTVVCLDDVLSAHTRILVTHATGLVVPEADHIVVLDQGRVVAQGSLAECRMQLAGSELAKLLETTGDDDASSRGSNREKPREGAVPGESWSTTVVKQEGKDEDTSNLIEEEEAQTGSVPLSVYKLYFVSAGGIAFWVCIVGLQMLLHFLGVAGDNVLRLWATAPMTSGLSYLGTYAAFGAAQLFMAYWFPIFEFYGSIRASRTLHDKLIASVLRAPIAALVLVAFVAPTFLFFLPPVFWAYWQVAKRYLASSRELKRFDSITRSPIYSAFDETLNGVPTIRAFGQVNRFMRDMYQRVDTNHAPWWLMWMANRWLNIRTEAIDASLLFCASIAVVVGVRLGLLDAGWAGLALTYALGIGESVLWLTRIQSYLEMSMNSVQRVDEFCHLPQEAPVLTAYPTSDKLALDHITFNVPAASKVAIVGRTGSGKSSMAATLFRMWEPLSGHIVIDGVDTREIGLGDLRSRMTIIPQDPTLFTGTIRQNLDMFQEHSDAELRSALDRVNLTSVSLDDQVHEGAVNWSVGTRQLIALARAFVRSSKILVLDESSASVDNLADQWIQHALRQEFRQSTVLCIAHRLRTVIDMDLAVVLSHGKVVEMGTPWELLQKPAGDAGAHFRKMCEESGEWEYLLAAAKAAEETRAKA
ncbi:hypothetical protein BCR44DRAFT_1499648 [Catenaria anguillulae PL171]|uniref:P-loop containing nucleoside triphosphate hydrolase protein n=1 Tax=Catenaria anguillulae PL171 TaxID=765915 RepID=A0A1Y2HP25_9FUNG|nr:hypothetical protein BCR44DRAFT_1499648 [Catenaria anguillulae PL171]